MEFLKQFHWTDTLLKETEKQAVEDILFEYHDMNARHRMDIGMNTDFNAKLTPKYADPTGSRLCPHGQIWDHRSLAVFRTGKSDFCTDEFQRKITSPCGFQEKQHPDSR